jgi:hypothetical protein
MIVMSVFLSTPLSQHARRRASLVTPMRWHHSSGYQTMGRFAMGSSALGISFGVDVNVLKEAPGPHRMMAWKPGAGRTACGIAVVVGV